MNSNNDIPSQDFQWRVDEGDCLSVMRDMPDNSIHCCVTSPPYWGLRDYGHGDQLGQEKRPDCLGWATGAACGECYVCRIVAVFTEVRRILREDGTLWLNLGDSYVSNASSGIAAKNLSGTPWRVALALQSKGWILRNEIIWHKTAPMPESVNDRCTKAHEQIFLLTKTTNYEYDIDAIREPHESLGECMKRSKMHNKGSKFEARTDLDSGRSRMDFYNPKGRNKRTVWTIPHSPNTSAHFATYPPALVVPCIRAGCPVGGIVFDPFTGSGTTGVVALQEGRRFLGAELNPEYADLARQRIGATVGSLFNQE